MSNDKRKRDDENDQRPQRDENTNNGDNMPRFSFTWIYILIGLALLGLQLSRMFVTPPTKSWEDFEAMVRAGDIEKMEVVNKETARAYIKKDSLCQYFEMFRIEDKNKDCKPDKPGWNFNAEQMYISFNIGSMDVLKDNLLTLNQSLQQEKKSKIVPVYVDETNWTGTLMTYLLPLLLLMAIWIFVLRRMGGGAGGPGSQIFNIGKSKATLFDNNSKVNITFTDVAGLDEANEEFMEIVDFLKKLKK